MLRYVTEEVDRVKGLFQEKEARLAGQRDAALSAERQAGERVRDAERRAETAAAEAAALAQRAADAERPTGRVGRPEGGHCASTISHCWVPPGHSPDATASAMQAAQARGAEAEAKHREEAERWRKRVAEVEHELRCLLVATERQKKAASAKVAQLARAVHELQAPLACLAAGVTG